MEIGFISMALHRRGLDENESKSGDIGVSFSGSFSVEQRVRHADVEGWDNRLVQL